MWRKRLGVVALLVAGGFAVESAVGGVTFYYVIYDFTVHIDTPAGDPPSAVGCRAFGRQGEAERIADLCRNASPPVPLVELFHHVHGAIADPYVGGPLHVRVKGSSRDSLFGRELSRAQYKALVVGAEWPDGRRVWKVVEIPDGSTAREVRVPLP